MKVKVTRNKFTKLTTPAHCPRFIVLGCSKNPASTQSQLQNFSHQQKLFDGDVMVWKPAIGHLEVEKKTK